MDSTRRTDAKSPLVRPEQTQEAPVSDKITQKVGEQSKNLEPKDVQHRTLPRLRGPNLEALKGKEALGKGLENEHVVTSKPRQTIQLKKLIIYCKNAFKDLFAKLPSIKLSVPFIGKGKKEEAPVNTVTSKAEEAEGEKNALELLKKIVEQDPNSIKPEDLVVIAKYLEKKPAEGINLLVKLIGDKKNFNVLTKLLNIEKPSLKEISSTLINHPKMDNERALKLIKFLVREQIEPMDSQDQASILRSNTTATALITAFYSKHMRANYQSELDEIIKMVNQEPSIRIRDQDFESAVGEDIKNEELNKAKQLFTEVFQKIEAISLSNAFPNELKQLNSIINKEVGRKFGEEGQQRFAPQIHFLRFFNPILSVAAISGEDKKNRNGINMSKLLQQLANSVEFSGAKEPYMVPFNEFLFKGTFPERMKEIGVQIGNYQKWKI